MPTFRVYRIMEMHGCQDVEADSEIDAIAKVADDVEPENWEFDGYGDGDTFYVYSQDGKPIKPQTHWTIGVRKDSPSLMKRLNT